MNVEWERRGKACLTGIIVKISENRNIRGFPYNTTYCGFKNLHFLASFTLGSFLMSLS